MTDNSVSRADRATASFLLRCVVGADPCRETVKPSHLAGWLDVSPQQAGSILAALGRESAVVGGKRPGGRGGARWEVVDG